MPKISPKISLELYKKVFTIREVEKTIIAEYDKDEMKTPMHMSMGEEAIVAGISMALQGKHQAFGTYRSHGLYLALTDDVEGFFGEMYGKATGVVQGKGGSMHLLAPEKGLLGVSAIVGSTIPLAVGASFANFFQKKKKVVAVFFGDGAVDEGVFWESINLACLMKLPVLFVYENNGYAVHTSPKIRHGYKKIEQIIRNFDINVFKENSTDPEKIYQLALKAIDSSLSKNKPSFLSLEYYRYLEHVGVYEDFNAGYRKKTELNKWLMKDPVKTQRKNLLRKKVTDQQIQKVELNVLKRIEKASKDAKNAPFPKKEEIYKGIFYEQ